MRPQRDDSMRQDNIREEERKRAQDDLMRDRLDASSQEVIKGIALLNSGAVVAMLGFAQSLIKQDGWLAYKVFALSALALFFVGALMGPLAYAFRMEAYRSAVEKDYVTGDIWLHRMSYAISASFIALILGAGAAGYGIYVSF